jgi:RNA polymerase sigma factor (sigma-70 family)
VTASRRGRARVVPIVERDQEIRVVAGVKAGDAAAFEAAYAEYRPRLFSFLARLSRRRDVAEDLLEETWLRFVAHARHLSDDTHLGAWLFTVARNLHVSWCRSRALDADRLTDLTPAWPDAEPGETPFEAAARSETERRLERALARLPLRDREIVLLVGLEGLSPSDVAAALGLAAPVVRKRLQRARARLASAMVAEAPLLHARAG